MSTFKTACLVCGFTHSEAAEFLGVNPKGDFRLWIQGKRMPPDNVWLLLSDRFAQIEDAADHATHVFDMDGIHAGAWFNVQANFDPNDPLPKGAAKIAGTMGLLRAINPDDYKSVEDVLK